MRQSEMMLGKIGDLEKSFAGNILGAGGIQKSRFVPKIAST
jgi:hypothetical protein